MNKKIEGINEEFQELGNALNNLDFSNDADKKKIYDRALNNINKKEGSKMLKNKFKKAGILVASLLILVVAANPTYATNVAKKIVSSLSLGKVSFEQNVESGIKPIEECYKGKVFDKNGDEVTSIDMKAFFEHKQKLYTKDGKEILYMSDGKITTRQEIEERYTTIEDKDKIKEYVSFDYKLPEYIPEGYEFKEARYRKDDGVTDGKVYYTEELAVLYEDKSTGENIFISQLSSEQPFSIMTNNSMEQIKVNDVDGVIFENGNIGWAINDVSYVLGSYTLSQDELLKIAESIR